MDWFSPGIPTGLVHGQLLCQPGSSHRGQAAADPRCPCRAPSSLGGGRVAGPGRQSGFHSQLGSLHFSSASSGETARQTHTCRCAYTCMHESMCTPMYVMVPQPGCQLSMRTHRGTQVHYASSLLVDGFPSSDLQPLAVGCRPRPCG